MCFFSRILDTLGLGSAAATQKRLHPVPEAGYNDPSTYAKPASPITPSTDDATPEPGSRIDVVTHLAALSEKNPQKPNWRTSIVDLPKLPDIDSRYGARKALATELGCPAELMDESAKMNVCVHKTVLRQISANGGNAPADLLD